MLRRKLLYALAGLLPVSWLKAKQPTGPQHGHWSDCDACNALAWVPGPCNCGYLNADTRDEDWVRRDKEGWKPIEARPRFYLTIEPIGAVVTTQLGMEAIRLDCKVRINGELAELSTFPGGLAEPGIYFSGPCEGSGVSELLDWMSSKSCLSPKSTD